jgi:hypothetical protein
MRAIQAPRDPSGPSAAPDPGDPSYAPIFTLDEIANQLTNGYWGGQQYKFALNFHQNTDLQRFGPDDGGTRDCRGPRWKPGPR